MRRFRDIFLSLMGIVILMPFGIVISIIVLLGSKGGIFYLQERIGRGGKPFTLYKFRTMKPGSDSKGLLTVGKDSRVTATGSFLRKSKLDELPQLFNVLAGEMSLVGPRPEVRKYVETYSDEQKKVLMVRPGLTDYASLQYIRESDLLGNSENPEKTYIEEILPAKIALNLQYINERKPCKDTRILIRTFFKIIGF